MNTLLHWLTLPEWAQVVKALLHSLWQGALIAAGLALLLRRITNPSARYCASLGALGAVMIAAMVTWAALSAPDSRSAVTAPGPVSPMAVQPAATGPVDKIVVTANWTHAEQQPRWTAWLALGWLVGTGVMLGRASVKVAGAEQLRRSCRPLNDSRIADLVAEARRAVNLTRQIRVAVTNQLTSPAVVGVLMPTLILPLSLITTLSQEQIRFVLLHELAHIRRGDYLANLFQLFAEALLFFNPAVWWLSHQIRREREACCDALAIELSGAPTDYARTLVSVAETMLQPSPAAAPAFGNEREPSSLSDRVQRVLVPGYRPSLRLTWRAMLAALVLGGVLLGLLAAGTRETVAATATLLARDGSATNSPAESPLLLVSKSATNINPATGLSDGGGTNLHNRTFKVEAWEFNRALGLVGPVADTNYSEALRGFLAKAGVDLRPPKAMFYGDRTGMLFVRATLAELDAIEALLQVAVAAPPQVNIRTKFVEVPFGKAGDYLGNILSATTNASAAKGSNGTFAQAPVSAFTGILTDSQFKAVVRALKSNGDVTLLSAPEVTTLGGRQVQMLISPSPTQFVAVINPQALTPPGLVSTNDGNDIELLQTNALPFELTLDLIPEVMADGQTMSLSVTATGREFLGYDPQGMTNRTSVYIEGHRKSVPSITPRFRVWQTSRSTVFGDGQTMVFEADRSTPVRTNDVFGAAQRQLLIFITPTIIDPAGNRVHADEPTLIDRIYIPEY